MSDNWTDRATGMICATCRFAVPKDGTRNVGRCRRHAPTMQGFPVIFPTDWCGDHKLDENFRPGEKAPYSAAAHPMKLDADALREP